MFRNLSVLSVIVLCLGLSGQALSKSKSKGNLVSLIGKVSKLTGKQFIFGDDPKGSYKMMGGTLTKTNAFDILTMVLDENGYTVLEAGKTGQHKIIHSRDIRYHLPTIHHVSSKKLYPKLPPYTYGFMKYQLSHPETSGMIVRDLRPFMSRYGRVLDNPNTGEIWVLDKNSTIEKVYELIKDSDNELSSYYKEKSEEAREFDRKLRLEKAKHCGDHSNKRKRS